MKPIRVRVVFRLIILSWVWMTGFAVMQAAAAGPDGEALFAQKCMICHGPAGRAPKIEAMASMKLELIEKSMIKGVMKQQAEGMSPAEIRSVAQYITQSQKPTNAGQLKACSTKTPLGNPGHGDWANFSPDPTNTRFQPKPGLTASDVPKLQLKWSLVFPGAASAANPVSVIGGRLFVGSWDGTIYSLDPASGCAYWTFKADSGVRTAISVHHGMAYFGDFQSNIYGVDAETGSLKWKTKVENHPYSRITASLAVNEGTIYVPVSSLEEGVAIDPTYSCCTFRGSLVALDGTSGKLVWKSYTIDQEVKQIGLNKKGIPSMGPSGAPVWTSPTIDTKRGAIYVTTGNSYSGMDTPATDALIAFDLRTGAKRWTKNLRPSDQWNASCMGDRTNCPENEGPDYDFGSAPVLVQNDRQDLILAGQKSGVLFAVNPDKQGSIFWESRVGEGNSLGGIEWGFSTDGNRVYVAISDMSVTTPYKANGSMAAVDLATGKILWRTPNRQDLCANRPKVCSNALMSAVASMPGVAFEGSHDGFLRAYDAATGKVVWEYDTSKEFTGINAVTGRGGSISAAGATVAGGQVYQTTGYAAFGLGMPGNALLVFAPGTPATATADNKPKISRD